MESIHQNQKVLQQKREVEEGENRPAIEFQRGTTARGEISLWHQGFRYIRDFGARNRFRCSHRGCLASAKLESEEEPATGQLGPKPHNHPPPDPAKYETDIRRDDNKNSKKIKARRNPSQLPARQKYRFKDEFGKIDGIERSRKDDNYFFCVYCQMDIQMCTSGRIIIALHQKSRRHIVNAMSAKTGESIEDCERKFDSQHSDKMPKLPAHELALITSTCENLISAEQLFGILPSTSNDDDGQVDPVDLCDMANFHGSIMLMEMARKMQKLHLDFEASGQGECTYCCRPIKRIQPTSSTEAACSSSDSDSMSEMQEVQTAARDAECMSLAVHALRYHPEQLGQTLKFLFGDEQSASHCFPFLDFTTSAASVLFCAKCGARFEGLKMLLRHANWHYQETIDDQ